MDTLIEILKVIGWPGVAFVFILRFTKEIAEVLRKFSIVKEKKNDNGEIINLLTLDEKLTQIGNHNHHESRDSLQRIENLLTKMNDKMEVMHNCLIYVKARINGHE